MTQWFGSGFGQYGSTSKYGAWTATGFCAETATIDASRIVPDARTAFIGASEAGYGSHVKFFASSISPDPLYCACLGYAHIGRLRPANARPVAVTDSGATPFSTQSTTAPSRSNESSAAAPPPQ